MPAANPRSSVAIGFPLSFGRTALETAMVNYALSRAGTVPDASILGFIGVVRRREIARLAEIMGTAP